MEILRLAPLIRSFRERVQRSEIDLEESVRELTYGSELIVLKLKWLLPAAGLSIEGEKELEEEVADPKDDFQVTPVMTEDEVSRATELLRERMAVSSRMFNRGYTPAFRPYAPSVVSIDKGELREALSGVLQRSAPVRKAFLVRKWNFVNHLQKFWREVRGLLSQRRIISFSRFVGRDRMEAIMNFLALLELVRRRRLFAQQLSLFGEIEFTVAKNQAAAAQTDSLRTEREEAGAQRERET